VGYRLPLVTTIIVFMMMIFGAVVVGTGAGFACPDWPLCHGQYIPSLDDPLVLIEWGHRLTSGLGGILILLTAFQAWRHRRENPLYKKLAILTVFALALQGLAGAAIVVFRLPGYMTTIDLTNGMFLLSIFVVMTALGMRKKELQEKRSTEASDAAYAGLFLPASLMVAVTLVQVVVGGLFRHTGAGEALFGRNDYLKSHFQDYMPSQAFANAFLMFHIMMGVLVTAAMIWLVAQSMRKRVLIVPTVTLLLVVLIQMLLGFVTLGTELDLTPVTAHLADATLMTLFSVYMAARAYFARTVRDVGRSQEKSSVTKAGQPVVIGTN
jgi:cytochrome c oxidase assembly protein subunit 15